MSDDRPPYKVPAYKGDDYDTKAIYEHICELDRDKGTDGQLMADNPLGDNIKRAKWAAEAVRAHAKETGCYENEPVLQVISDLMNDLRHLLDFIALTDDADAADGNPTDLEALAARDLHYQAEIRGTF